MPRSLIIANDREIDIATSEQAERWAVYGWRVALDCSGDDERTIREKAHAYARQHGKRCRVPQVRSDQEAAGFEMVYLSTSVLLLRRGLRQYAQRTALAAVAVAVVFNSLADYGARVPDGLVSFALFVARFDGLALALSIMDSLPLAGLSYAMATLLHRLAEDEVLDETDTIRTAPVDKQVHDHSITPHETTAPVYALPTEQAFSLRAPAQLASTEIHASSSSSGEMHPAHAPTDTPAQHRICPVCCVELDTKRYANARRWKRCPACKATWQ